MTTSHENTTSSRRDPANSHDRGFAKGLFGGVLLGTAAGVLFAPEIFAALRRLRRELADASGTFAEGYRDATAQVGDAVADFQQKGHRVYERARSVVTPRPDDVPERAQEAETELNRGTLNTPRHLP